MSANKYHAKKTMIDGITFDSKKEANRYCELKLLQKAHMISNLELQVPFELIPKSKYGRSIVYIADFLYEQNGLLIVEDAKGFKTPVYKLKKRLMQEIHGVTIKEV